MFKELQLHNIKSFHSANIPLTPFTLLLGANASGKSNIRDTFRFLHGLSRGYKLVEVFAGKFEGGDQIWQGIRGGPFEFITKGEQLGQVGVKLLESSLKYNIAVRNIQGKLPRISGEALVTDTDILYTIQQASPRFTNISIKPGGDYRRGHVETVLPDEATLTQIPELYRGRTDAGIEAVKQGVDTLTSCFENMRFLALSPNAMREASYTGQNTLGDRGENLSSVLQYLVEEKNRGADLVEWLRALTPMDVADLQFERDTRGRTSLVLMEHNKRATSVHSASDGTLRFLAYLALTFSVEKPTLCFVEEIDNGIPPSRLKLLVELMETQSKLRQLQVVATSHSPALLNLLSPETLSNTLLVYRTEGASSSKVKPLHELPHFQEIAEKRRPGVLMESGWLENTVEALEFTEDEEA